MSGLLPSVGPQEDYELRFAAPSALSLPELDGLKPQSCLTSPRHLLRIVLSRSRIEWLSPFPADVDLDPEVKPRPHYKNLYLCGHM